MGGTLVWAIGSDIANLDGHLLTSTNYETVFRAYDRLTALDSQGQPQPQLAESWELSSDAKQLKLSLRKGVQYHTGREFTSDDVKWNILRVRDPKVASGSFVTQSGWFAGMETPDKYTLIATFDAARPAVFDFFQLLNMVDPVTMQGPDASMKSVGTGPFVLTEWSQGDRITFTKNRNYWQSGRPYLDGIETPIVKDPAAMIAQLEGGAIDVADTPLIRDFNRLKTDPKFQGLVNQQDGQHFILAPNTTVAPFDNKLVRQALRFAIDRYRGRRREIAAVAAWLDRIRRGEVDCERIRPGQGRGAAQAGRRIRIRDGPSPACDFSRDRHLCADLPIRPREDRDHGEHPAPGLRDVARSSEQCEVPRHVCLERRPSAADTAHLPHGKRRGQPV
jgi:peptide/nickel transport system substrate-binding protein